MTEVVELRNSKTGKDRLLTANQVEKRLGVCKSMVYSLIDSGELASFRLFRRKGLRVFESSVVAYIKRKEMAASEL